MKLVFVAVAALLCLELALAEKQYLTSGVRPKFYHGTDLSIKETKEARKMQENFWELNRILMDELANVIDPDVNLKVVKSWTGIQTLLFRNLRKACKLFLSMKEASGKCDFESYKILAEIYEAIDSKDQKLTLRVIDIFLHYQRKHADECRPKYRKMYDELKGRMDRDQLEKLDRAFSTLKVKDFKFDSEQDGSAETLASMPTIRITEDRAKFGLFEIVKQVLTHAMESPNWNQLKSEPTRLYEEYLMAPCRAYHGLFNEVLAPARFDAKTEEYKPFLRQPEAEEDKIPEFFGSDYEFSDAIAYNRICGSLLDEQETLKKRLPEIGTLLVGRLEKALQKSS